MMFDIGKLTPDWMGKLKVAGTFEPDLCFNRAAWLKEENYIKFVRDDENHSIGGLNPGMYRLIEETWCLNIGSTADSEEEVLKQLQAIPHHKDFKKIIIQ